MRVVPIIYFIMINLISFFIYALDKKKSQNSSWRISEKTLLFLALIGGSLGALLAMRTFRHKTKHKLFTIGVPLMLILNCLVFILIFNKLAS